MEPRFSDRQVKEILRKAVEESPLARPRGSRGLSLTELHAIGAEVGIDPARLDHAVRAVTGPAAFRPNLVLGAPLRLSFERTVGGTPRPDRTAEMVALIRKGMGAHGEVSEVGGALEWSASGEVGKRHVTVAPREGGTAIYGTADLANAAVVTYLPAGILGTTVSLIGFFASANDGSVTGMLLFPLILPVLYLVLRTILQTITGREAERLHRVVDELAGFVAATEPLAADEHSP
ncbi:MAG: hypothetical protein WEB88_05135 [Gemmatimonadota bacterium]